ncbi:bifunctional metallophosphatase/5'-nucleotidase [Alkaliphilus transvaalensis]|uniref:bifunctional metallophosphatase/5'-nucleotidase n=1 Tax=Alkaliphilus transvaalensis TaxID=114628 RepID=UPI00047D9C92|nr:bifunctional UDP-sugar hydrolase/5'-nucleotidase [Alkaliphilus transvaalensis]
MKNLKIYFTSDIHAYVFPTDYRDRQEKPVGLLNMMSEFTKDENTLIIDGGDTIQGSSFASYLSNNGIGNEIIAEIMNEAGYDYITLGNHDFNYGYDYLKNYINHFQGKCLCTNVTDHTNGIKILPYDIKTLGNGLVVGVIGFTTDFITTWEKKEHLENFTIDNTYASVVETYQLLKPQVDVLIGIYHGGFEYDLHSHKKLSPTSENIAYTICKDFEFDILLTGHQHMEISGQDLHGTFIAQTPENGKKYIEMEVLFEGSKIKEIRSELKTPKINPNKKLYEKLLPIENQIQNWLDQPVGFLDVPLQPKSHIEMALEGSYIVNFANQVSLEVSGADLACSSLGNSVKGFHQEVSIRDIVSTYIYPNTLVVLEVTGKQLLLALERCGSYFALEDGKPTVSELFLKPKVEHYNYDFFSNLFYSFDLRKEAGNRVTSAKFKGRDIEAEKTYTLVMNNYRATGAGGYDFYKEAKIVKEIQVETAELIIDYFKKNPNVVVDKTKYIEDVIY